MHVTLTDHLTCPRCGPSAGLVLLMEQAEDRRVVTGALGCPLCRTRYPIAGRVADLRTAGGAGEGGGDRVGEVGAGVGVRVAALLELAEPGGFVLVDGPAALEVAVALRAQAPDVELAVVIEPGQADAVRHLPVSALLAPASLPVTDRVMRAAAFAGGVPGAERLAELMRVVRPTGRLLIETAGAAGDLDGAADAVVARGAAVRARDATGLLAVVF